MRQASVVAVLYGSDLLYLLRGPTAPTYPNHWGLPGGFSDPGETTLATALRELREETGLSPSAWNLFPIAKYVEDGISIQAYLYNLNVSAPRPEIRLLDGENTQYVWRSVGDAPPQPAVPGLDPILLSLV